MQTKINCIEQNNDHSRIMHKMQLRSSFNIRNAKLLDMRSLTVNLKIK